jgi:hypothetical protein
VPASRREPAMGGRECLEADLVAGTEAGPTSNIRLGS